MGRVMLQLYSCSLTANGMTAVYYPDGLSAPDVLPKLIKDDIVVAFSGVYWNPKWYKPWAKPDSTRRPSFLPGTDEVELLPMDTDVKDGEDELVMIPEIIGEIEGVRVGDAPASE